PGPPPSLARKVPQDRGLAIAPAPNTRRQTGASVRCGRPSNEPAPSDARWRPQKAALVPEHQSDDAQAHAPRCDRARQARRDVQLFAGYSAGPPARCAPAANNGGPSRPSSPSCGADTCTEIKSDSQTPGKTLGWHYTPKSCLSDSQPLDSIRSPRQIDSPIPAQTAQVGLGLVCLFAPELVGAALVEVA